MLFVVFGVIEFMQFFFIRNAFGAAGRDAVRAACLHYAVQTDPATRAAATLAQANVTLKTGWMTVVDLSQGSATVSDCSAIPMGDRVMVTVQCPYGQVANALRPLYAMTGIGIGSGKMCVGQAVAVKD
jgi:Flp pilus assembly protein TadG